MIWKKQPTETQIAALNSKIENVITNIDETGTTSANGNIAVDSLIPSGKNPIFARVRGNSAQPYALSIVQYNGNWMLHVREANSANAVVASTEVAFRITCI